MAFPRFPTFPAYGTPQMMPMMVPIVSNPYLVSPGLPPAIFSGGPRAPIRRPMPPPMEKPPVTTTFVGNIHERCTNELIRSMLQECGNVLSWKRIQGSNGKYQAFGFCEFEQPESTLRALRILHSWPLGEKRLVVKVDEKTRDLLRDFINKKRERDGKPALKFEKDELPSDEDMKKDDTGCQDAITQIIMHEAADLVHMEEGEISSNNRSPTLQGKGGNLDVDGLDREKKEYIHDEIKRFRDTYKAEDKEKKPSSSSHHHHHRRSSPSGVEQTDRSVPPPAALSDTSPAAAASPPIVAAAQKDVTAERRTDSRSTTHRRTRSRSRRASDRRRPRRSHRHSRPKKRDSDSGGSDDDRSGSDRSSRSSGSDTSSGSDSDDDARPSPRRKGGRAPRDSRRGGGGRRADVPSGGRNSRRSMSRGRSSSRRTTGGLATASVRPDNRPSEDEEDVRERRRLEKKLEEKERSYNVRLKRWEERERKKAKSYERQKQQELQLRYDEQKEAKKLKEFLEDYDDERDDVKYYKSGPLFQRRREFEREREADVKDRLKEQEEIEELKQQILAEGNCVDPEAEALKRHREQEESLLQKLRAQSDSPSPHQKMEHKTAPPGDDANADQDEEDEVATVADDATAGGAASSSPADSDSNSDDSDAAGKRKRRRTVTPQQDAAAGAVATLDGERMAAGTENNVGSAATVAAIERPMSALGVDSPVVQQPPRDSAAGAKAPGFQHPLKGVFGEDVDEEQTEFGLRKPRGPLVPFELTQEERMQTLTPEERKQMIKKLIESIPTGKDQLFAYPINWDYVDKSLIDNRVKPWVSKKIVEYIGDEEPSLVDFICQKVSTNTQPQNVLDDVQMILDDEAEVFVVKMWRLLIYESEAKKLGLVKGTS